MVLQDGTIKPLAEPSWNTRCSGGTDNENPAPNVPWQRRKQALSGMHRNSTLTEVDCDRRHLSKWDANSTTASCADNCNRLWRGNKPVNSRQLDAGGCNTKPHTPQCSQFGI